jgi:tetratricopeptide (TPR) repeat protein
MRARTIVLLIVLLGGVAHVRAELSASAFDSANKLYEQGKFAEAASAYEGLLASRQASAPLYFNLGNAFFKAGQIGRALAAYRQAEQIAPRDPDIRANLQFARNQVQGPTCAFSAWQRWVARLTVNEWTLLAAGAAWALLLLLAYLQWRPESRRSLRNVLVFLAAAAVALGACLAFALVQTRFTPLAIVTARESVARQGPLEDSPSVFTVHDGAELRVLDQKDEWLQVSPAPRRIGWLRRDQVLLTSNL